MGKRLPGERWQAHVLEGYEAFLASPDYRRLRCEGKRALGRTTLLTAQEWHEGAGERMRNPGYRTFCGECRVVGERYGLAEWTVRMACLLRGFRPDSAGLVVEDPWPEVRIVTEAVDSLFVQWLLREAWHLGLVVVQRRGGADSVLIAAPLPTEPGQPLTAEHRPPLAHAFFVRVETPSVFPPEAAADLHRRAQQAGREILRRLGYRVPKRLRASTVLEHASKLRLGKERLDKRETGDIAEDLWGEGSAQNSRLKKQVRDQRHRAKGRLAP